MRMIKLNLVMDLCYWSTHTHPLITKKEHLMRWWWGSSKSSWTSSKHQVWLLMPSSWTSPSSLSEIMKFYGEWDHHVWCQEWSVSFTQFLFPLLSLCSTSWCQIGIKGRKGVWMQKMFNLFPIIREEMKWIILSHPHIILSLTMIIEGFALKQLMSTMDNKNIILASHHDLEGSENGLKSHQMIMRNVMLIMMFNSSTCR